MVMNGVVCCDPDMRRLVCAAADRTQGLPVMSFPKMRWWTRLLLAAGNFGLRAAGREFQVFLHQPERIRHTADLHGLRALMDRAGLFRGDSCSGAPRRCFARRPAGGLNRKPGLPAGTDSDAGHGRASRPIGLCGRRYVFDWY